MQYVVEVAYTETVESLDWRNVRASSRAEAVARAIDELKRQAWPRSLDVVIQSATAHERKELN